MSRTMKSIRKSSNSMTTPFKLAYWIFDTSNCKLQWHIFIYILDKDIKLALTPVSLEALKENYLPSGIGTVKLRGSLIGGYLFCSLV